MNGVQTQELMPLLIALVITVTMKLREGLTYNSTSSGTQHNRNCVSPIPPLQKAQPRVKPLQTNALWAGTCYADCTGRN